MQNSRQVHRGSIIFAATEGLCVYVPGQSKAFSHCVIVTLVERPGFDHDSILAAKRAATRFIISDIVVKDFETARNTDLDEARWETFDTYRRRVVDSKDADPILILAWLVCEKRSSPFLQMMPISITRRDLAVNGPEYVADPMPWGDVVCRIKDVVASEKPLEIEY